MKEGIMFEIHVSLIALVVTLRYTFLEDKKGISFKKRAFQLTITSVIQLICTGVYWIETYGHDQFIFWTLVIVTSCLTGLIMNKWVLKFGYWFLTNCMITALLMFMLIQYDKSPFQGLFGGIREGLTPIFTTIYTAILQSIIWIFIKFQKWLAEGTVREKQPLKKTLIRYIKIICFQVLLSIGIASIFCFNNLFLFGLSIIITLFVLFIMRQKITGNYLFWAISWGIIFWEIVKLSFEYGHIIFKVQDADLNEDLVMICLIGFPIYHILLAIYFKLKEDKK
ncbi:membrane hypothetical protein [Pseudolactococcus piscium]|nr:membrane hypothetical protein [Lactococcus piscium]